MKEELGMGWLPDYPDVRDFTAESETVGPLYRKLKISGGSKKAFPATADLREWCSPIENQGRLGSCTAQAAVALVEYFERRAFDRHIDASRLFVYKTTRNLLHWTGDRGAFLRSAMGALVLFGVPPEEYWPYDVEKFDQEPPAFCYAFAANYQPIKYVRLDPIGLSADELLKQVKEYLVAGLPSMFGFTVYRSISQAATTGRIPYPAPGESVTSGHAVVAVGYDDGLKIRNIDAGDAQTTGALLIRNSWGADWGEGGYGWLPYQYVVSGLALDWWSVISSEWVDTGHFGR